MKFPVSFTQRSDELQQQVNHFNVGAPKLGKRPIQTLAELFVQAVKLLKRAAGEKLTVRELELLRMVTAALSVLLQVLAEGSA